MINNLFSLILRSSSSASVVILLLLMMTPFLNKRYFMKWKYRIWLLLSLYLCIPADYAKIYDFFAKQYSIKTTKSPIPTIGNVTNSVLTTLDTAKLSVGENTINEVAANNSLIQETAANLSMPSPLTILSRIWLTGIVILLLIHGISYFSYKKKMLSNASSVTNPEYLSEFENLLNSLRIQKNIKLLIWSGSSSPMMIGFFNPYLILPNEDFSAEEIHFILKHELFHYKRHDIYGKLLFMVAKTIHWFNPIVALMCKEAVIDMELSCDEAVINAGTYDVKKAYAETLFSTLSTNIDNHFSQNKSAANLSTQFHGGAKIMKKRFENILSKTKKRNGIALLLATILLIVGCQATTETKPAMYMQLTQLSEEESDVAKLIGPDTMWLMFDYVTDDTLQSFQLNQYELVDGKWQLSGNTSSNFTGTEGRLALKFNAVVDYLDYEIQSENDYAGGSHGSPMTTNTEEGSYTQISSATLNEGETAELVYEKELPLLIQTVNPEGELKPLELESFYTPEALEDIPCDHIYAATITFSQKTAEELPEINTDISTPESTETIETDTSYLTEAMMEQRPLITDAIITLNKFAIAYFTGDVDTVKLYLTDTYNYDIETYPYGETAFAEVSELTFDAVGCSIAGETKEIPEWSFLGASSSIETDYDNLLISGVSVPIPNYDIEDGYTLVFSISLKAMPFKKTDLDYREYLTVEMVRQGEGWKIQAYGLEL